VIRQQIIPHLNMSSAVKPEPMEHTASAPQEAGSSNSAAPADGHTAPARYKNVRVVQVRSSPLSRLVYVIRLIALPLC